MRVVVVYVHGLWLPGGESWLLRRRVAAALGAETRMFRYSSVRAGIAENASALGQYLTDIAADTLHLVAHSLGGLVVLKLFERGSAASLPPGRVVLLGSPVRGSLSSRRLVGLPFGRGLLGRTGADVLLAPRERRWPGGRDLGVIAGNLGVGLGRLLGGMAEPNDGTVRLAETDLPGAREQLCLRVSHSGMVFSKSVADQTAAFLRNGQFDGRGLKG